MTRILLVEDDIDVRLLLEHALAEASFEVISVETVKSAKRLIEAQLFDLVLTDGILPDGTGIDVADEATAYGARVLIVTGQPLSLPVSRYPSIFKPVRPTELIDTMRSILGSEWNAEIVHFRKPAS